MTEPARLLNIIDRSKAPIAAFNLGLAVCLNEAARQRLGILDNGSVQLTTNACPILHPDPKDQGRILQAGQYTLSIKPSLEFIKKHRRTTFDFLGLPIKSALLDIGDALKEHNYLDNEPALEFFRHIRNGIAHGNRFNIKSLTRTAKFKNLTIDLPLHGTKVLPDWEGGGFLHLGDCLELIDTVRNEVVRFYE